MAPAEAGTGEAMGSTRSGAFGIRIGLALLAAVATTAAGGCGDDDSADVGCWDCDVVLDHGGDVAADADADTGADADGSGAGGPDPLYDGPRNASAVVPGWDPDHPQPLIVFAKYDASDVWYVSMAEIDEHGVVGGMVTERVRFWGWSAGDPDAPTLLYEGPLDATARIPGWSSSAPFPIIALTRYAGSTTWFASMATIDETGLVGGPVTDELKVWGWPAGATGAPDLLYDGPRDASAVVPGWSVADPRPLVVLTRYAADPSSWWLSMAEVSATGVVGGMITDTLRVWGW